MLFRSTVDDLMTTMQTLQSDTTLHGLDKLEPTTYQIDTAHGPATQVVNYDGSIDVIYSANTMNNMNSWANTISSPTYSPGAGSAPSTPSNQSNQGGSGQNGMQQAQQMMSMMQQMFGQSSQIMQEMFKRLAPQQEKESKKMHEKLNKGKNAQKLNDLFKEIGRAHV